MRRALLKSLAVVALMMIVGGHISDPFGLDHEFKTGQEIDYSIVVLAASGAALLLTLTAAAARLLGRLSRNRLGESAILFLQVVPLIQRREELFFASPPALRI